MTVLPSAGERYLSTVLFNHLFSQVRGSTAPDVACEAVYVELEVAAW